MLRWTETMAVGVGELDAQHMRLITIYNKLGNILLSAARRDAKLEIVMELADYSLEHFKAEETLMEQAKFEGLEAHKKEHLSFKLTILDYHKRVGTNDPLAAPQLLNFLHKWIRKHICEVDALYAPALSGGGGDEGNDGDGGGDAAAAEQPQG